MKDPYIICARSVYQTSDAIRRVTVLWADSIFEEAENMLRTGKLGVALMRP